MSGLSAIFRNLTHVSSCEAAADFFFATGSEGLWRGASTSCLTIWHCSRNAIFNADRRLLRSCLPAEVCRREKHLKEPLTFSPLCHYSKSSRLRKHWRSGRGTPYSGFLGQWCIYTNFLCIYLAGIMIAIWLLFQHFNTNLFCESSVPSDPIVEQIACRSSLTARLWIWMSYRGFVDKVCIQKLMLPTEM